MKKRLVVLSSTQGAIGSVILTEKQNGIEAKFTTANKVDAIYYGSDVFTKIQPTSVAFSVYASGNIDDFHIIATSGYGVYYGTTGQRLSKEKIFSIFYETENNGKTTENKPYETSQTTVFNDEQGGKREGDTFGTKYAKPLKSVTDTAFTGNKRVANDGLRLEKPQRANEDNFDETDTTYKQRLENGAIFDTIYKDDAIAEENYYPPYYSLYRSASSSQNESTYYGISDEKDEGRKVFFGENKTASSGQIDGKYSENGLKFFDPQENEKRKTGIRDRSRSGTFSVKSENIQLRSAYFYERIKHECDEILSKYKRDATLEKLLPLSKFVRIEYSSDGKYYVFGVVGEAPDFICFGVPSKSYSKAPSGFDGVGKWLPVFPQNAQSDGYWLIFQSAKTGEEILA